MAVDSAKKTILVALALCFVCSVLVSTAAVYLKPLQEYNKQLDKKTNIVQAAGLYKEGADIEAIFKNIEAKAVDITTGEYIPEGKIDLANFDEKKAAKDPQQNITLDKGVDVAKVKRISKIKVIYLVKDTNDPTKITKVILPIHGYGLWSTLYGFIAVSADLNTISGLTFYEHAETPGLGGEVDNKRWKAQWNGKLLYAADGSVKLRVIKGKVDTTKPEAKYQIDGLAGATITANGVSNTIQYWLGKNAWGKYIERLRKEWNVPLSAAQETGEKKEVNNG